MATHSSVLVLECSFFFFHLDCDFLNTKLGCRIKMHKSWFDKWHVTVVASIYKTSYKLKGSALASISCAISYLNRALTWAFKMSSWYFFLSLLSKCVMKKVLVAHSNWLSSVQLLSRVWLFATTWTTARQASLSIINSRSPPKPMSIESVMPSNHLILCHSLFLLPSIFPSIRVFSNESANWLKIAKNLPFPSKLTFKQDLNLNASVCIDWKDDRAFHWGNGLTLILIIVFMVITGLIPH